MQFLVPQFIDVEAKIFGPISVRQFLILAISAALMYFGYAAFPLPIAIPIDIFLAGIAFAFAFIKINSQPLHIYMRSFIRTFRKPRIKVWQKTLAPVTVKNPPKEDEEAKTKVQGPAPEKVAEMQRLEELSLILDTGGTYRGEEERELVLPGSTAKAPALKKAQKSKTSSPPAGEKKTPPGGDLGTPGEPFGGAN